MVGVECISLVTLLTCVSILSSATSKGDMDFLGEKIGSTMQCVLGTWAFIGILSAVTAGCAVLYRNEVPVRLFHLYLCASFFPVIVMPMCFVLSGSLCDKVVPDDVQKQGEEFVCGFTDTFIFFWLLVAGACHIYFIYIVWSAAEEIALAPYPELIRYADALRHVYLPDQPEQYKWPLGHPRAAALHQGLKDYPPGLLQKAYGSAYPMPSSPEDMEKANKAHREARQATQDAAKKDGQADKEGSRTAKPADQAAKQEGEA